MAKMWIKWMKHVASVSCKNINVGAKHSTNAKFKYGMNGLCATEVSCSNSFSSEFCMFFFFNSVVWIPFPRTKSTCEKSAQRLKWITFFLFKAFVKCKHGAHCLHNCSVIHRLSSIHLDNYSRFFHARFFQAVISFALKKTVAIELADQ